MKKIDKNELYGHLRQFLKNKGVDLQDGSYTRQIQHGCGILADTINLSQQALKQAKSAVGKRLDQVRQVIHEKTAPKAATAGHKQAPAGQPAGPRPSAKKARKPRTAKPGAKRQAG